MINDAEIRFIKYVGTVFEDYAKIRPFGCCNLFDDCSKQKRCVKLDESNIPGRNLCSVFNNLARGEIYMSSRQKGIEGQKVKEVFSTLENGVGIRYLIGRNSDKAPVYIAFLIYDGQYLLLDSLVTREKMSRSKLDKIIFSKIFSKKA